MQNHTCIVALQMNLISRENISCDNMCKNRIKYPWPVHHAFSFTLKANIFQVFYTTSPKTAQENVNKALSASYPPCKETGTNIKIIDYMKFPRQNGGIQFSEECQFWKFNDEL